MRRGYEISFAGNVTYPSAGDLAAAAASVPEERLLVETDAPYLTPQAVRKQRNQPAYVAHTVAFLAACEVSRSTSWARRSSATRRVCSAGDTDGGAPPLRRDRQMSVVADGPVQASLYRMRRFSVRPDRELGQNFLIDSNILGVIERAAELSGEDVVLEVGGGVGVLSEYLAERVSHVHVIEIDERLRDALRDATDPYANVSVHWADAMRSTCAR